jgi:hypothetical protein
MWSQGGSGQGKAEIRIKLRRAVIGGRQVSESAVRLCQYQDQPPYDAGADVRRL